MALHVIVHDPDSTQPRQSVINRRRKLAPSPGIVSYALPGGQDLNRKLVLMFTERGGKRRRWLLTIVIEGQYGLGLESLFCAPSETHGSGSAPLTTVRG